MFIFVGLGNPGKDYENTYHNMGWLAIDELANLFDIKLSKKGFKAEYGEGRYLDQKVMLVKPQTYMNKSGECFVLLKKKYKDARIIVLVDDFDLPRGTVRYRQRGSAGTHRGLKSIVEFIGQDFERIKLGIGREDKDCVDYVLSRIDDSFLRECFEKMKQIVIEQFKNKSFGN